MINQLKQALSAYGAEPWPFFASHIGKGSALDPPKAGGLWKPDSDTNVLGHPVRLRRFMSRASRHIKKGLIRDGRYRVTFQKWTSERSMLIMATQGHFMDPDQSLPVTPEFSREDLLREVERLRAELAETQRANAALEATIEAKGMLIQEVDHRVKNNLQMISSLLSIQTRNVRDQGIRSVLDATRYRIEALGAVHKRLYQAADISLFDASEFVRDLTRELMQSMGRPNIAMVLRLEPVELPAKKASAIALIVNELVMNALKHAFPNNRPGTITVHMAQQDDGLSLTVADDGIGMARDADKPVNPSFGMTLVTALARQFTARITWTDANPGTCSAVEIIPQQPE